MNTLSWLTRIKTLGNTVAKNMAQQSEEHGDGNPFKVLIEGLSCLDEVNIAVSNLYVVVLVKNKGGVMVLDKKEGKIQSFGCLGRGDDKLKKPTGVAINKKDHILVVDQSSSRIRELTMEGTFVAAARIRGNEVQLWSASGICVLPDGLILVADTRNRIQALNPDLSFFHTIDLLVSLKFTTTIHPALCRTICTMKGFDLWSRQDSHIGLLTQHGQNAIKIRDRMQQDKERKREREATYGKSVIIISQASLRAWLPIIECPT